MSKREFKKYIESLKKNELKEQMLNMYAKFRDVKEFFDFAFEPKEDKLLQESKFNIRKEYFPNNNRKAKTRRSIAHKAIKHFICLGVDKYIIAELMLFNLIVMVDFLNTKTKKTDSFCKSMHKSYCEALLFCTKHNMISEYKDQLENINNKYYNSEIINLNQFEDTKYIIAETTKI